MSPSCPASIGQNVLPHPQSWLPVLTHLIHEYDASPDTYGRVCSSNKGQLLFIYQSAIFESGSIC